MSKPEPATSLSDYQFELPTALIAQAPANQRSASRLLLMRRDDGTLGDCQFVDIVSLLRAGDLLVVNDTRVVNARMLGVKPTGGRVELLLERQLSEHLALAQVRTNKQLRPGATMRLHRRSDLTPAAAGVATPIIATVIERHDDLFELELSLTWDQAIAECGELPLPPYINRAVIGADEERYQTVFAANPGAVAAPTAGLHFDAEILTRLQAAGINHASLTLHVGAGTFQPIRGPIEAHRMHSERYQIDASLCAQILATRAAGGKVIAVGTTVVRALESAALAASNGASEGRLLQPVAGDTRLFIQPGFQFRVVDGLITNFHLPATTLLMLVSAFSSREHLLNAYAHAVREQYRFFSYGDAMLLL